MPKVSILLVHYKTPEPLKACLKSIFAQNYTDFEIIIIDNEFNAALSVIISAYPAKVTLVQNTENVGFGRANNQAATLAQGDYLFLLNPDASLLKEDDLSQLLNFAEQHAEAGVIGVKILDQQQRESTPPWTIYPGLKHF